MMRYYRTHSPYEYSKRGNKQLQARRCEAGHWLSFTFIMNDEDNRWLNFECRAEDETYLWTYTNHWLGNTYDELQDDWPMDVTLRSLILLTEMEKFLSYVK
jgi:hypothetical protein